ncbi:MAG: glycosyl hydrolase, partial [Verrucomicrobiales bacterium]|nr:glycosyl hydrolase [Verrucomicrobiales bacterium]
MMLRAIGMFVSLLAVADGSVIKAGAGSYLTERPAPCKALPEVIYKTAEVAGATVTGQWWSSLVWQEFSQVMYAHPLAMRAMGGGLAVCYPGSNVVANGQGIFGGGFGEAGDLTVGHSGVEAFPKADCGGYSDWFVTAVFEKGEARLETSFGHGSPFVYARLKGGDGVVRFAEKPVVWSGGEGDAVLGVTVKGRDYGLFGGVGSTWSGTEGSEFVNSGKGYFSLAVLPERGEKVLAEFTARAHQHVVGTRVEYRVAGGFVETEYGFELEAMEGGEGETVYGLYPHQWKYLDGEVGEGSYGSVRGEIKLAVGSGFRTRVPVQGVLPMLPAEGTGDRERLLGYLRVEAGKDSPGFGDTYWEGKHLGKLATLSGTAEAAGAEALRDGFIAEIKRRLEAWFTAVEGKAEPVFYYDERWGTLVGSRPSYGSDAQLNDHHFHYGYFIRAAAEVARLDPEWAEAWGPMVELLIRDVASTDREDAMFPYLRCFDKYAGHSWASGDANFGDGNNQESSSESMNAWYGMVLWGEATGNRAMRDAGVFLFNTERTAVEEYWFDVAGTNYPETYPNVALGMVWGGKGAFATW